ncbi:alanine/glycine:cation symporter family protein [Thiocapsa imhoffii]|nr:sodium:alanine symporter family protein [Thiocapsa imhoffii]
MYVNVINGWVWGPPMIILIIGTGLYLSIGLRGISIVRIGYAFRMMWQGRRNQGEGDITPFNALMTSLAATIGTGNIAGVATAIAIGGPGALFWMWITALVGMATKYAEALLAMRYREVDERGDHVGGPMYYIKNGLGKNWIWLGTAFAIFGGLAGFGIGNTVQANSVAHALNSEFGIPELTTGLVIAALVGLVLIGGIRWIAEVAGKLVPFMAIAYVFGGLVVIALNITEVPAALSLIVTEAFTPTAGVGGFAGASIMLAIQMGVARGIFSNEAGLGSAPIAHAAASSNSPVEQGTVAMLGTFIDTIIVCTITGLVIVMSGAWSSGETGAGLSALAFSSELPGFGGYVVSLGLALFAFTTILGWAVYGERCVEYLFGVHSIIPFRFLWVLVVPIGAIVELDFIWLVADTLNALMAIPNLVALLLLSPVVFKLSREHFDADRAFTQNR